LIFVKVVLVVLVVCRFADVLGKENSTSDLLNSADLRLSSDLTSAHVVSSMGVSSIASGRVIDLTDLLVEALDSLSLFTASALLIKLLLVESLVQLEYLLLDAVVSSSLVGLILLVLLHLVQHSRLS